jgi:thioredoxin reductase (NADPH)
MERVTDVIIIGSGPAGLTAGLYTSRARLSTIIFEKESIGGELANRDMIENYPGFAKGILGPQLAAEMAQQAMNYGVQIEFGEVQKVDIEGDYKIVRTTAGDFYGKFLIIASGSRPKKLGLTGEDRRNSPAQIASAVADGVAAAMALERSGLNLD